MLITFPDLIPGNAYKILWRSWADTDFSNPYLEQDLGIFIRHRLDIPDWNQSVLEFQQPMESPKIVRAREVHAFIQLTQYKKQMEQAEIRMTQIINGTCLKEELIAKVLKPTCLEPAIFIDI
jgi:hypothetical protein